MGGQCTANGSLTHQTTMISLQRHIDKYITSGTWSLDFHYMITDWELSLDRRPDMLGSAGSFLLEVRQWPLSEVSGSVMCG